MPADGGDGLHIVEKRHVAECRAYAEMLRGVVGDGSGGGAAVDVEEFAIAQHGHEFGHQFFVAGGFFKCAHFAANFRAGWRSGIRGKHKFMSDAMNVFGLKAFLAMGFATRAKNNQSAIEDGYFYGTTVVCERSWIKNLRH